MTLRNTSKTAQPLTFGSGQSFDVIARDPSNKVVWQWARGRMFTQAVREESLAAGKTLVFNAEWDGTDDGKTLAPNSYKLEARLKSIEQRLVSPPVSVTIKAKTN